MKTRKIFIGLLLLALLSSAVVFLTQSMNTPVAVHAQEPLQNSKAEKILEIAVERNIDGEITSGEVQVRFVDPDDLPNEAESVLGVFLSRQDDVLTIGTGNIEVLVNVEVINDEEPVRTVRVSNNGPSVEILVTPATVIYADITPEPEISDAELASGSKLVTRTIVSGALEALEPGMILRMWGPVQNGVVTAEVLVYESID